MVETESLCVEFSFGVDGYDPERQKDIEEALDAFADEIGETWNEENHCGPAGSPINNSGRFDLANFDGDRDLFVTALAERITDANGGKPKHIYILAAVVIVGEPKQYAVFAPEQGSKPTDF